MSSLNNNSNYFNSKARKYLRDVFKSTERISVDTIKTSSKGNYLLELPAENYRLLNWNDFNVRVPRISVLERWRSSSNTGHKKTKREIDVVVMSIDELKNKYKGCKTVRLKNEPSIKDINCYRADICRKNKLMATIGTDDILFGNSNFQNAAEKRFNIIDSVLEEKADKKRVLKEVKRIKLLCVKDKLQIENRRRLSMKFDAYLEPKIINNYKKNKNDITDIHSESLKTEDCMEELFRNSKRQLYIANLLSFEKLSLLSNTRNRK